MKGSYCLIINIKKDTEIKIGKKLGFIDFKKDVMFMSVQL